MSGKSQQNIDIYYTVGNEDPRRNSDRTYDGPSHYYDSQSSNEEKPSQYYATSVSSKDELALPPLETRPSSELLPTHSKDPRMNMDPGETNTFVRHPDNFTCENEDVSLKSGGPSKVSTNERTMSSVKKVPANTFCFITTIITAIFLTGLITYSATISTCENHQGHRIKEVGSIHRTSKSNLICYQYNKRYIPTIGKFIHDESPLQTSAENCLAECATIEKCSFWSWKNATQGKCYLISSAGSVTQISADGYVSGNMSCQNRMS